MNLKLAPAAGDNLDNKINNLKARQRLSGARGNSKKLIQTSVALLQSTAKYDSLSLH